MTQPTTSADAHSQEPAARKPYRIVWDDFRGGLRTDGDDAKWFLYGFGPYIGDDGKVTTTPKGLRVVASGTNPTTGEPAFVRTLAQEADNGYGLPGTLEHVKYLAFANHKASSGFNGFDAVPGQVLTFESWMSGRTYGTSGHPFGDAVTDPEDDLRLASVGMPLLDEETSVIFDFFLSNRKVYVVYERLPFTRQAQGNYAAFVYQIPVADREPDDWHHFQISYDVAAGTVEWVLDGQEVFRVDRIGHLLPSREHLVVDHGGEETTVAPRQLNPGFGMFTSLDYARPGERALVRISGVENYYYDTARGEPHPQTFIDDKSAESNRLFGQGAEVRIRRLTVSSFPAR